MAVTSTISPTVCTFGSTGILKVKLVKFTTAAGDFVKVDLSNYKDMRAYFLVKCASVAGGVATLEVMKGGGQFSGVSTADKVLKVPAATAAASSMNWNVFSLESAKYKRSSDGVIRFSATQSTKLDSIGCVVFV
jgi:hypothetical protein